MRRLSSLFIAVAASVAATVFPENLPQVQAPAATDGPFPLLLLVESERGVCDWRPDWPSSFPPDSFSVSGSRVRRIEVRVEGAAEGGEPGSSFFAGWDDQERLSAFPYSWAGEFSQVTVRRSASGMLVGLSFSALSASASAAADGSGDRGGATGGRGGVQKEAAAPLKTVVSAEERLSEGKKLTLAIALSDDGLAESGTMRDEADRSFVTFAFRGVPQGLSDGDAVETRYDGSGAVTGVVDYRFFQGRIASAGARDGTDEEGVSARFDYDSFGRVAAVFSPSFTAEAVYDGSGRVARWRVDNGEETFERTFQWDERGFLVRETLSGGELATEYRYEYSTDSRGNWIERRSSRWVERFGAFIGEEGPRVRRKIIYR